MSQSAFKALKPYAVTLSVYDFNVLIRWYCDKLDFRLIKEKHYPEFGTSLVLLELNGFHVELIKDVESVPSPKKELPPAHTRFQGLTQFSFLCEDIDAVRSDLTERGIPLTWEFSNEELGLSFIFIQDPEGNLIQFMQKL
ncbi:TPA: VOC family protein [Vibrio alginolyticus]